MGLFRGSLKNTDDRGLIPDQLTHNPDYGVQASHLLKATKVMLMWSQDLRAIKILSNCTEDIFHMTQYSFDKILEGKDIWN